MTKAPPPSRKQLLYLIAAMLLTIALWQIPWGNYILYPFTVLATWFHEMGHGLTAMLLGGDFLKLVVYSDGSGIATHSGPVAFGRIGRALVAAGGPMGPSIAGACFILASRNEGSARIALYILGGFLLVSVAVWVRSIFGIAVLPLIALVILFIAAKAPAWVQGFSIQLLGIQACISNYRQIDYLFTKSAVINGQEMLSDSGKIAEKLFLPYWFWGALMTALSLYLLYLSIRVAYRASSSEPEEA